MIETILQTVDGLANGTGESVLSTKYSLSLVLTGCIRIVRTLLMYCSVLYYTDCTTPHTD